MAFIISDGTYTFLQVMVFPLGFALLYILGARFKSSRGLILIVCVFIFTALFFMNFLLVGGGHVEGRGSNSTLREIIINGRVTDKSTSRPLNKRLVILFLNGEEIGRDTTKFKESIFTQDIAEPGDGIFSFTCDNKYKVSLQNLKPDLVSAQVREHPNGMNQQGIVLFNAVSEGQQVSLQIPSKVADYRVKVIPGEIELLPIEFAKSTKTYLLADNRVSFKKPETYSGSNPIKDIRYDTHRDTVVLRSERVPLNNCGGDRTIANTNRLTQTYVHEVTKSVDLTLGVEPKFKIIPEFFEIGLSAKLQGHYGFREGETSEKEIKYDFEASPGSNIEYVITWQEVWESGSAFVQQRDGSTVEIPFRVKTALIYGVKTEKYDCGR